MLEILLGIIILLKLIFGTIIVHEIRKPQMVIIRPYSEFFDAEDDFTEDDFEHKGIDECGDFTKSVFKVVIEQCEVLRKKFNATQDKKYWRALIELLPEGYRMRATVMLNYEVLANIYKSRKNHKLDEWVEFCKWIESLPYSELITGISLNDIPICNEIMEEAKRRVTNEENKDNEC